MALRPARREDAAAVAAVFGAARRHWLPYLPVLHSGDEDRAHFAAVIGRGGVTVAVADGVVMAFLALDGGEIEHLYVAPAHHRRGHGRALLAAAQGSRDALELWVFQRNAAAIAFYVAHGFAIVSSTDGSGNEEREPDHRMAWTRRGTTAPGTAPAPTAG